MDDQNTTATDQGVATNGTAEETLAKLYGTKEEAEANKPADAPKGMRPFEVGKGGVVLGWINARGYDHGLSQLAKRDGYSLSTGKATAPVTKETIAARLGEFSDDELAAMGLTRKKSKK